LINPSSSDTVTNHSLPQSSVAIHNPCPYFEISFCSAGWLDSSLVWFPSHLDEIVETPLISLYIQLPSSFSPASTKSSLRRFPLASFRLDEIVEMLSIPLSIQLLPVSTKSLRHFLLASFHFDEIFETLSISLYIQLPSSFSSALTKLWRRFFLTSLRRDEIVEMLSIQLSSSFSRSR